MTKVTTISQIRDCIRVQYQLSTNAEAARLVKAYLVKDSQKDQQQQFQRLPAYLATLKAHNPTLHSDIQRTPANLFQRLFICPHESCLSFQHMRKFIAVDGTFLKARYVQTLLFAVGIDANGKNLILAWGIVERESSDAWIWFLSNLKAAIPETVGMTLMSDRDKGLKNAQEVVYGSTIVSLICCFHFKGIISKSVICCKKYILIQVLLYLATCAKNTTIH